MKNTFGNSITATLFGESHGEEIGIVLDGLTPGIPVDQAMISDLLSKRRPVFKLDTERKEQDHFRIVSGLFRGKTTGTPLCILIPNEDVRSRDYLYGPARPSHADYAAYCKYHGFEDYRGGGHFSGRLTAPLVAAGGIFLSMLKRKGIEIASHILQCADVSDRPFSPHSYQEDFLLLQERDFPVLEEESRNAMQNVILKAAQEKDSVGGIVQTAVIHLPAGLGEPWFDSVESCLAHALFSLGGIKGISFGEGFDFARMKGSQANDAWQMQEGKVPLTLTNHNGGINGGITNGMPVVFQCAVKPTPSIGQRQKTVDFIKNEDTYLTIGGRHDPSILRRLCPVITAVTSMVVCDLLAQRYGTDFFR